MLKTFVIEKEKEILTLFRERMKVRYKGSEISPIEENRLSGIVSMEVETGGEDHPVLAQYHFVAPAEEDVDTLFFHQSICLRDNIEDYLIRFKVLQAANTVNNLLPFGYFGLDESLEILCYRNTLAIPTEIDSEIAEEFISKNALKALGLMMRFAVPLASFAKGDVKEDRFLSAVMSLAEHFNEME